MKSNNIFLILFCMISMLTISACEKSEIQKSTTSTVPIEERTHCIDECDECPPADCCCSIELLSSPMGSPVNIQFCGTSTDCVTDQPCSSEDVGICADINGFIEYMTFTTQGQKELFCVPKNVTFGIISATGGGGAPTVRLTCQAGSTSGQTVTIQLNTPPDKPYWSTDNDCLLTDCF